MCPSCEIKFSFFARRHHCRKCGGVFCADCTVSRVRLTILGYHGPVRVCNGCAEQIRANDSLSNGINSGIMPTVLNDPLEWDDLLLKYRNGVVSDSELSRNICGGVPASVRRRLWTTAISTKAADWLGMQYQVLASTPSEYDEAILLDIARTFPSHPFFTEKSKVLCSTSCEHIHHSILQLATCRGCRL